MKQCPTCGGVGRQPFTGAIRGWSKALCETCGGSGRLKAVEVTAYFAEEGYPRSGYQYATLQVRDDDVSVRWNLSLKDVQALRDKLEEMLHKFWSESDGENPQPQEQGR